MIVGISSMSGRLPVDTSDVYSASTAKFLAMYIVNLIVVLHGVFMECLTLGPTKGTVVFSALGLHASNLKTRPLNNTGSFSVFSAHPENVIASIIKKRLGILPD